MVISKRNRQKSVVCYTGGIGEIATYYSMPANFNFGERHAFPSLVMFAAVINTAFQNIH